MFRYNWAIHTDGSRKHLRSMPRSVCPDSRTHRSSGSQSLPSPSPHSLRRAVQVPSIRSLLPPQTKSSSPYPGSSGYKYHTYEDLLFPGTSSWVTHNGASCQGSDWLSRSGSDRHPVIHGLHRPLLPVWMHTFSLLPGKSAVWHCRYTGLQMYSKTAYTCYTLPRMHLFSLFGLRTGQTVHNVHLSGAPFLRSHPRSPEVPDLHYLK